MTYTLSEQLSKQQLAGLVFKEVFRTATDKPGFFHINLGSDSSSKALRSLMVTLKNELSLLSLAHFNKSLAYHWLVRFDQQVNTPFHIDNAGDQSFLMLGYEPSEIASELSLADFHRYAKADLKTLENYLNTFEPVFKAEESQLAPFTTTLNSFKKDSYNLVIINNSHPRSPETLGVFHKAHIKNSDLQKSRIVNSMLINMVDESFENKTEPSEKNFIDTSIISK